MNVHAVIAVYVAGKARPRSRQLVLVYHLKSHGGFEHPEGLAFVVKEKEADGGSEAVVTHAPPATEEGRNWRRRRSVDCPCGHSNAASSKRLQSAECDSLVDAMDRQDPGSLDGRGQS